jgi:hypothetical protein
LLVLPLFTAALGAQPVQRAVMAEEAFQLSGVPNQVRQLPEQFQQQFDQQIEKIPAAQRAKMAPIARKVLADFIEPQSFYRQLKATFIADVDVKAMQAALAWLHSPLPRRMQKLQDFASSPEGKEKLSVFAEEIQSAAPPLDRINLMRDLDQAVNWSGFATDVLVKIAAAVTLEILPGGDPSGEVNRDLVSLRKATRPMMANEFILRSLFAYKAVSDDDLKQYIDAVRSEAAQWYIKRYQESFLRTIAARAAKAASDLR